MATHPDSVEDEKKTMQETTGEQDGNDAGTQAPPVVAAADSAEGDETKTEQAEKPQPELDALGRAYATGKRKTAIARVWLKPGKGEIIVNKRKLSDYFGREVLRALVRQPLKAARCDGQYDIWCSVKGSGTSGQAGAIRHGVAKSLCVFDPSKRPLLKHQSLLTRDSRIVERKKYGKRKARRSFQFSKR